MTASRSVRITASTLAIALLGAGAFAAANVAFANHWDPGSAAIGVAQPAGVIQPADPSGTESDPTTIPIPTIPPSPPKTVNVAPKSPGKGQSPPGQSPVGHGPVDPPANVETVSNELTSRPAATLQRGDSGPLVSDLESSLSDLGYWLGNPDDAFDDVTRQAVVAFQKVEGLKRTGIADPETLTALLTAERPGPRVTNEVANDQAQPDRLDVELDRQVLFVVRDNKVALIFDVSTGAPSTRTPAGTFTVYRDVNGVDRGPLGSLYRPKYFYIGIAFHGYPKVPPTAASHGCVRVGNAAMDFLWFLGVSDIGNQVIVY